MLGPYSLTFIPLPLLTSLLAGQAVARVGEKRYRILVRKGERRLYLFRKRYAGEALVASYPIALGSQPHGPKRQEGDGATPEGRYYVTHKNPRSKYHLSLGLSYPNQTDAEAGLERGLITRRQYAEIIAALKIGGKPPQQTGLGGDIFIHGGGGDGGSRSMSDAGRDWTQGCIALDKADIEELFRRVPVRTEVRIEP